MNQMLFIRTTVFQLKQAEFADMAKVGQATVSRWEHGESSPSLKALQVIRAEAIRRGISWDDEWLYSNAPTSTDGTERDDRGRGAP